MINATRTNPFLMGLLLIISLLLMLLPLPNWMAMARPLFYPAAILFWAFNEPRRFGIITAWLCGLPLDVLSNSLLGQHGLALALAAYVVLKLRDVLLALPVWQQGLLLLPILALYEFTLFWIDGINGRIMDPLWRWLPVLTTTAIWPLWHNLQERFTDHKVN